MAIILKFRKRNTSRNSVTARKQRICSTSLSKNLSISSELQPSNMNRGTILICGLFERNSAIHSIKEMKSKFYETE